MINMNKQSGSVLILSLVLLIIMTILALSSMNNTIMEEKMAGNLFRGGLAFQAAETALREGEARIMAWDKDSKPSPAGDGTSVDGNDGVWVYKCPEFYNVSTCSSSSTFAEEEWWFMTGWKPASWDGYVGVKGPVYKGTETFNVNGNAISISYYYLIEFMKQSCESSSIGQQGDLVSCVDIYRLTAIGRGPGDQGAAYIQSTVARRF